MNTTSKALRVAFAASLAGAVSLGSAGMAIAAPPSAPLSVPAMTQAEDVVITITDFSFDVSGPVSPGATVTVTNNDSEAHTVSSTALESGSIPGGTSLTFSAPSEPGEYPFICDFHGNMMGTLVVQAAAAPAPTEAPEPASTPAPTPTSQMGKMPVGGADTGVQGSSSEGSVGGMVLGGGLLLALAAGGTYVVRRATSNN
ncbi:cupredoxin domain-containing protein [Arthrobacter sp. TMN-50]